MCLVYQYILMLFRRFHSFRFVNMAKHRAVPHIHQQHIHSYTHAHNVEKLEWSQLNRQNLYFVCLFTYVKSMTNLYAKRMSAAMKKKHQQQTFVMIIIIKEIKNK